MYRPTADHVLVRAIPTSSGAFADLVLVRASKYKLVNFPSAITERDALLLPGLAIGPIVYGSGKEYEVLFLDSSGETHRS